MLIFSSWCLCHFHWYFFQFQWLSHCLCHSHCLCPFRCICHYIFVVSCSARQGGPATENNNLSSRNEVALQIMRVALWKLLCLCLSFSLCFLSCLSLSLAKLQCQTRACLATKNNNLRSRKEVGGKSWESLFENCCHSSREGADLGCTKKCRESDQLDIWVRGAAHLNSTPSQ